MIRVFLTKTKTSDGITLDGIYVAPKKKGKTALIWLHGLTSRFYSGQALIKELSGKCARNGIGYFKFNTRGNDIVTRGQGKHRFLGTAFEKFKDCVYDVRAMIGLARRLGYKNIVLAGHSTGANKTLYYLYKTRDRRVKGLILLGPTNDIDFDLKKFGAKEVKRRLNFAKKLRKKSTSTLLPPKFGIWNAQRLISILTEGASEDVFPYYNMQAKWRELKSVKIPAAVIFGARDEYLTIPAKKVIEIFRQNARQNFPKKNLSRQAKSFSCIIVKGGRHSFYGKEKELSREVIKFIKRDVV